jgi:hypothetical protein
MNRSPAARAARCMIAPFAMAIEITAVGLNNPYRGIGLQLI